MGKKFNKTASKQILDTLKMQLDECRQTIFDMNNDTKDSAAHILKCKKRITMYGEALESTNTKNQEMIDFLVGERKREEKHLTSWRNAFKTQSKEIHDLKEEVRHLQHAIETLKKEFNQ